MKKILMLVLLIVFSLLVYMTLGNVTEDSENEKYSIQFSQDDLNAFNEVDELEESIRNVSVYRVIYSSDEREVMSYMLCPEDMDPSSSYPTIIFNRGAKTEKTTDKKLVFNLSRYVEQGYIVFMADYGVDVSNDKELITNTFYHDGINLLETIKKLSFIDDEAINMHGFSKGGSLTYRLLRNREDIRAAAVVGAPSDLELFYNEQRASYKRILVSEIGGTPETMGDEYLERSAVHWFDEISTPLLLIHGTKDYRVDVDHTKTLFELMDAHGSDVKMLLYDDDHNISENGAEARYEILQWFNTDYSNFD